MKDIVYDRIVVYCSFTCIAFWTAHCKHFRYRRILKAAQPLCTSFQFYEFWFNLFLYFSNSSVSSRSPHVLSDSMITLISKLLPCLLWIRTITSSKNSTSLSVKKEESLLYLIKPSKMIKIPKRCPTFFSDKCYAHFLCRIYKLFKILDMLKFFKIFLSI